MYNREKTRYKERYIRKGGKMPKNATKKNKKVKKKVFERPSGHGFSALHDL